MSRLNRSITSPRRSITNRSRAIPFDDQKGNLTALHFQILRWVEAHGAGETRPEIEGLSTFAIDRAVAELVLAGLIKGVSVPQHRYKEAHWEAKALTWKGWQALVRHRRAQPRPVHQPWWRIRLFG